MGKLPASEIRALRKRPDKHYDGGGLVLQVITPTRAGWCSRYERQGRERTMSLGHADLFSLAEAPERALACRTQLADGSDPLEASRAGQKAEEIVQACSETFGEAADACIRARESRWRNPKSAQQWRNGLAKHAASLIPMAVGEIEVAQVLAALQQIWHRQEETAHRVRGRIEEILAYAGAAGWRQGPNPALARGPLRILLGGPRTRQVKHHAAMDWREAPSFIREMHERHTFGARALEFAILTAARPGEVRGARWGEIDLDAALWTIAADRMKDPRERRIPLSKPALAILHRMAELKDGSGLVFIDQKRGVAMSDMTLGAVLKRMGLADLTAHGFRSTFSDWAHEATRHEHIVIEAALAHVSGDKAASGYHRGDLFEKRKALMADWAAFLARKPAGIVPYQRTRGDALTLTQ